MAITDRVPEMWPAYKNVLHGGKRALCPKDSLLMSVRSGTAKGFSAQDKTNEQAGVKGGWSGPPTPCS
jgi:hypothetical protein